MLKTSTALFVIATALSFVPSASAVAILVTQNKMVYCGLSEGEPPIRLICWRAKLF
jgi:hypothetical protein